ncbi:MAG: hypothetical protein ACWGOX_13275 [Desulforhopalus sp.]
MNSLTPVYFPGTDIYSIRQYPIFLLFQQIHLIKPVEDDPEEAGRKPSDIFINSGFCQVHTPCPLGDNRRRFLRLVDDIKNRQDDYAAQLSSLTLAGLGGTKKTSDDSSQSIIRSLLSPGILEAEAAQRNREEKLWQARLVLAIGEILDIEDEEIGRNLAMLEDKQAGLFKDLLGDGDPDDEESPLSELNQLESNLITSHSGNTKNRFNSWKTLYLESDLEGGTGFFTPGKDSGDILLDLYEKLTGKPPATLASLELPGLIGWSGEESLSTVRQFTASNGALISRLHGLLIDLITLDDFENQATDRMAAFAEAANDWHRLLEGDFPAATFGRIPLTPYIFAGLDCKTLIADKKSESGKTGNGLLIVAG